MTAELNISIDYPGEVKCSFKTFLEKSTIFELAMLIEGNISISLSPMLIADIDCNENHNILPLCIVHSCFKYKVQLSASLFPMFLIIHL